MLPLIVLVTQWFRAQRARIVSHGADADRADQRVPAGEHHRHGDGAAVPAGSGQLGRFDDINRQHRDANIKSIFYYAVFYPAIELIGALAGALIIWFGGGWVMHGTLTLGSLVAFLQYSQRFFRPISDMSEKFNMLQAAMASSERIFALLDTPVDDRLAGSAAAFAPSDAEAGRERPGHIKFEHVWFAYKDDTFVLRDVSFDVHPGERIGIVGATGAGKSTVINLLLRFYDVTRGRITIDGVDIREMSLADVRGLFGLVLQDVYLFTGTIASNIRLGNERITDEDVRRAVKAVHADRFIDRLPEGLRRAGRRARRHAVGRPEATAVVRARAGLRSARAGARRSDVERRHRNRTADPRRAPRPDGRPHHHRHRPPPVDHPGHGQDPGLPQGRAPRSGQPPGAPRAAAASTTACISSSTRTRRRRQRREGQ